MLPPSAPTTTKVASSYILAADTRTRPASHNLLCALPFSFVSHIPPSRPHSLTLCAASCASFPLPVFPVLPLPDPRPTACILVTMARHDYFDEPARDGYSHLSASCNLPSSCLVSFSSILLHFSTLPFLISVSIPLPDCRSPPYIPPSMDLVSCHCHLSRSSTRLRCVHVR